MSFLTPMIKFRGDYFKRKRRLTNLISQLKSFFCNKRMLKLRKNNKKCENRFCFAGSNGHNRNEP